MKIKTIKKTFLKPVNIAVQNYIPYLSAVLDPFLQQNPIWQGAFYTAIGLYGVYMAYNQEEVNEITQFIKEHPEKFREEIVKSKEFEKAFLLFFEQYMKQRAEEKKKILKNILLGYTLSENKTDYELERLNDCLVRMTIPTLKFLIFTRNTILPNLHQQIEEELKQDMYQNSDRSLEWWHLQMLTQKSIWEPISNWFEDNFNPARPKVKEEYGIKNNEGWPADLGHRADTRKRDKESEIRDCITELVTLGVFDIKIGGSTWGGSGGKDYSITSFGLKFLKQMDNIE